MASSCAPRTARVGRRQLASHSPRLALIALLAVAVWATGCLPSVIKTSHVVVLLRHEGGKLVIVDDDDPAFDAFQDGVLRDEYLAELLSVFEHTTEAFLSTNVPTSLSQTVANHLVIALDSDGVGVLRDVHARYGSQRATVERAVGLGRAGEVDMQWARRHMAGAMAPLLLELVGLDTRGSGATAPLSVPTTPQNAFVSGYAAALGCLQAQRSPELLRELRAVQDPSPEDEALLQRYELVPQNGFRLRYRDGVAVQEPHTREEALRTPGVVATLIYRLLQDADPFYPQRFMLWLNAYTQPELPHGKLLLAANRMGTGVISWARFAASYSETFPTDAMRLARIMDQVLSENH